MEKVKGEREVYTLLRSFNYQAQKVGPDRGQFRRDYVSTLIQFIRRYYQDRRSC